MKKRLYVASAILWIPILCIVIGVILPLMALSIVLTHSDQEIDHLLKEIP